MDGYDSDLFENAEKPETNGAGPVVTPNYPFKLDLI